MSITIHAYLVTFLTRKNVRVLIDDVFANYTKNNVLHNVFSRSMFLHDHVTFCDALRHNFLNSGFGNYFGSYGDETRLFEQFLKHHTFIEHIKTVQQMNTRICNNIVTQQRLAYNQMQTNYQNKYISNIDATAFNGVVDCSVISDYVCIKEITIFVKFVLNNFDQVGRDVLERCVNDDFFAISVKTPNTFYEHVRYTIEQNFIEYPDGEIIRRLCNTIPYTDFAEQWHITKQYQFAFLCEMVYEQYGDEWNKMICIALCDEYVMHFVCKFL